MRRSRFVGLLAASAAIFLCCTASALAAPEAPTVEPAEVSGTTATLKGVLNPSNPGEAGTYEFLYRLSATECEGESATPAGAALGIQDEAVSSELTGLQPSATYSFCLLARNEAGKTAVGSPKSFTTAAAPPAIDAEGSASVNATAATMAAQINPNNQETTYKFEYSTQATGETLEGTITKVAGASPLTGFGDQGVEVRPESLQPQTQYYWRVVAKNAANETTTGKVETFTTPLPPEAPTLEAELVGMTAHLKGVLNPNKAGEAGSYEFIYRQSATECEVESLTATEAAFGAQAEAVATEVGLQPNATYSFCLLARNQAGETAVSSRETLTTAAIPPAVDAESSAGVKSTVATLSAQINPNNQETTYKFEYSTQATGETLEGTITEAAGASPLTGFGDQAVEVKLESLQPRAQYFYRVVATNASAETTSGKVETFTTLDAPLVTTGAALGITRTKAGIAGTVNPGGLATRYHFVYVEAAHYNPGALECPQGLACAYGEEAKTTPSELLGATDYSAHAVGPQALEELKPGTTYHYALVASNSEGGRVGPDQTFTTSPAAPPSASTGEATAVSQLSATLTGTADTRGLPGTMSFQVALSPEGGSLEPASVVVGSQSGTSVSITFTFGPYLQPGTTYYYRAFAVNADGSAAGEWRSFTTAAFQSPFTEGPASIPLLHIPGEPQEKGSTKPLTNSQKLAKALKACHKIKNKSKRAKCERTARGKYATKHKK